MRQAEFYRLSFTGNLHFSVITLGKVGYGAIVAVQIVLGVPLLRFGCSETVRYARERGADPNAAEDRKRQATPALAD